MGNGASTNDVRRRVEGLGAAYALYGQCVEDNGVDGALCAELAQEGSEAVATTFRDLGITNSLHRRKMLQAMRAETGGRRRSGSDGGSLDSIPPAIVVEGVADGSRYDDDGAVATVAAVAVPVDDLPVSPASPATWSVALGWEGAADLDLAAAIFGSRGACLDLV